MAAIDPRDRQAYLAEQIERQKRGEPIDVEWVRQELARVQRDAQRKLASSQRNLRWLVVVSGILMVGLLIGGRALEGFTQRDLLLALPVLLVAALVAWAVRQRPRV